MSVQSKSQWVVDLVGLYLVMGRFVKWERISFSSFPPLCYFHPSLFCMRTRSKQLESKHSNVLICLSCATSASDHAAMVVSLVPSLDRNGSQSSPPVFVIRGDACTRDATRACQVRLSLSPICSPVDLQALPLTPVPRPRDPDSTKSALAFPR